MMNTNRTCLARHPNSRGFSLIELIVATAIFAIVALAGMYIISETVRSSNKFAQSLEKQQSQFSYLSKPMPSTTPELAFDYWPPFIRIPAPVALQNGTLNQRPLNRYLVAIAITPDIDYGTLKWHTCEASKGIQLTCRDFPEGQRAAQVEFAFDEQYPPPHFFVRLRLMWDELPQNHPVKFGQEITLQAPFWRDCTAPAELKIERGWVSFGEIFSSVEEVRPRCFQTYLHYCQQNGQMARTAHGEAVCTNS